MNCPRCGTANREDARFCRRCGAEFAESPVDVIPAPTEAEETSAEEPSAEEPSTQEPLAGAEETGKGAEPKGEVAEEAVETEEPDLEPEPEEPASEGGIEEPGAEFEGIAGATEIEAEDLAAEIVAEEAVESSEDKGLPEEVVGEEVPEDVVLEDGGPEDKDPEEQIEPEQGEEVPAPPEWIVEDSEAELEPLPDTEEGAFAFWREEAEPLTPVEPGTVVDGRYLVVEVLDAQRETILYYARDLQRCWQCDFDGNSPDDAFCAQCGASMDRKPSVRLLEVQDAEAEAPEGQNLVARLSHEGRTFLLVEEPKPEPLAQRATHNIRLVVGQRSDAGQVRELDEDSLLVLTLAATHESRTSPVLGLYAVADGMGGHEGGEVASRLALQVFAKQVIRNIVLPELAGDFILDEDTAVRMRQATMAANDAVFLDRQKRENDMGTTLTAVLIRDDRLFVSHVGDCRAYHWNADGLEQLTTDHSVVASMIASGQAKPEELFTHPHRSVIYRCIGDKATVQVDTDILPLTPGDRIIVCCDGLWEMVRDEGIEDVMMQEPDPQRACDLLIKHANVAGGEDNISVIVIQVEAM